MVGSKWLWDEQWRSGVRWKGGKRCLIFGSVGEQCAKGVKGMSEGIVWNLLKKNQLKNKFINNKDQSHYLFSACTLNTQVIILLWSKSLLLHANQHHFALFCWSLASSSLFYASLFSISLIFNCCCNLLICSLCFCLKEYLFLVSSYWGDADWIVDSGFVIKVGKQHTLLTRARMFL